MNPLVNPVERAFFKKTLEPNRNPASPKSGARKTSDEH